MAKKVALEEAHIRSKMLWTPRAAEIHHVLGVSVKTERILIMYAEKQSLKYEETFADLAVYAWVFNKQQFAANVDGTKLFCRCKYVQPGL